MAGQPPKILFDKSLMRIRLLFNPLELGLTPTPMIYPMKAKERMEQLKNEKAITDYVIYERIFKELLIAPEPKRLVGQDSPNENFEVVLAQGFSGNGTLKIRVEDAEKGKCLKISLAPQHIQSVPMSFEWIEGAVDSFLSRNSLTHTFDRGALKGLYLTAEKHSTPQISTIPLYPARLLTEGTPQKHWELRLNNSDQDLSVILHSVVPILSKESRRDLINEAQLEIQRINKTTKQTYQLLLEEIKASIREILAGPGRFGVSFPITFLVAKATMPAEVSSLSLDDAMRPETLGGENLTPPPPKETTPPPSPKEVVNENDPAFPYISFDVDPEQMLATIRNFEMSWYEVFKSKINLEWLKANMKRAKIVGRDDALLNAIVKTMENKADLSALMVAEGIRPAAPRNPFVELAKAGPASENDVIDFRASGSVHLAVKDAVIASVKYDIPGKKGMNVYGKVVPMPAGEKPNVRVGEFVIETSKRTYVAACNGVVIFEDNQLSVKESLVIEGGVNLATGNIDFRGAVVVEGNIESGSTVICDGPLIVNGHIEDAFVKVRGDIKVSEGIAMAKFGKIICGGDLTTGFAQNANLLISRNLYLRSALLNCQVQCYGDIFAKFDDSVVAGGAIRVRGSMDIAHLGFQNGAPTLVSLGAPFCVEMTFMHWDKRLKNYERTLLETTKQLKELKARPKLAHQAGKVDTAITKIEARHVKLEKLKMVASAKLDEAKKRMIYNQEATLKVRGVIHKSVRLLLGGKENKRLSDVAQSYFTVRPNRGRNIFRLDEAPKAAG